MMATMRLNCTFILLHRQISPFSETGRSNKMGKCFQNKTTPKTAKKKKKKEQIMQINFFF